MAREYKDSGIEWIGQIPKEWKLATLKQIGTYINGYAFKPEDWTDSGKPIIRIQDLTGSMGSPNFYNGELDSKYLVNKGDILVSWAATLDAFIWEKEEGWLNQHIFKALPSSDVNYQFFYWLIKLAMENMNNDNKHGIVMQHVTTKVFGNFAVCIPSVNEQQKIADYLDKVCGEVDEMVALQETMIEELKAYKQSVITEAVTKGLNPNAPMRDSGIDWIGKIPEHWKLEPLKYCFGRRSEKNNPVKTEERLSLSIDKGVTLYAEKTTNLDRFKEEFTQYQLAYPNDIVLNCMNMIVGAVGLSNYMGCVSPVYYVIYPIRQDINSLYYSYLLNIPTIRGVYYSLGKGIYAIERGEGRVNTCRLKVAYNDFGRLEIPVPPIEEQMEITLYIQQKCSEIDSLIVLKQAKIEELKEYKKSVIYEYVTGKKEVN